MAVSSEPGHDAARAAVQSATHSYAENVGHSRSNFFILLLAQLYCLITIETTQDAALLSNSTTQKLPILETSISIETFYVLAPLILLIIFFHFQIHLKSIWRSATRVSSQDKTDLIALVETYPWFITSSMARRFAKGEVDRGGFAGWFEYNVALVFGWFSTAAVIFMMWARFLTKHDWTISIYHAALVSLAIAGALYFLYSSRSSLQGWEVRGWRIIPRSTAVIAGFCVPFAGLIYATWWLFEAQDERGCQSAYTAECSTIFLLRDRLRLAGLDPAATLDGADVSARPEGWFPAQGQALEEIGVVRGANLRGEDLRYASAKNALFVRADMRETNLRLGDYEGAWFQGADLSGADLSYSSFLNANFDHALMAKGARASLLAPAEITANGETDPWGDPVRLPREGTTRLNGADFTGASFYQARLVDGGGADVLFTGANLTGMVAQGCRFEAADFREARFDSVGFRNCSFTDSSFFDAQMRIADFTESRFSRGDFREATMDGAVLTRTKFHLVTADRAAMSGADLFGAVILESSFSQTVLENGVLSEAAVSGGAFRDSVFRRADFRQAVFENVDLSGSDFSEALFFGARFDGVDMRFAVLTDADLSGADFSGAQNLTQDQLDRACGDTRTQLPAGLQVIDCAKKLADAAVGG